MKPCFSIVIPSYQIEASIPHNLPRLLKLRDMLPKMRVELIFVNDGSTDRTQELLENYRKEYPDCVKIISLTRNFGQTPAIQAGLTYATGECVGIISADLQEPCEMFVDMIEKWKRGAKFVIGARAERSDSKGLSLLFSKLYWWIINRYAFKNHPEHGYDFCLLDRQVVNDVNRVHEIHTAIFALIFWFGYRPEKVYIKRTEQIHGKSQNNFRKRLRIAIDTLIGFTRLPIRCVIFASLGTSFATFLYLIWIVIQYFVLGVRLQGWTTIVALILLFSALILFMLGIISEYLFRIIEQTRKRPSFVVDSLIGIEPQSK
jgi:polyisoprenyl-phosphate glycosyltransferase